MPLADFFRMQTDGVHMDYIEDIEEDDYDNQDRTEQLSLGLGWFSIGLGLAQIAAPRGLAKLIGVRGDYSGLLRMLGAREITSGIGLLTGRQPNANWMWSRVGGDAIDLALLGAAFKLKRSNRNKLAIATAAVAGVTALDAICSQRLSRRNGAKGDGVLSECAVM